tara:strand:+ start:3797 stop:4480 length:684 start_codon:yes stop_codon:yes gene_type:complete
MNNPKIILALDMTYESAINLAEKLDPASCILKVGSELYTSSGPRIVEDLQNKGFKIFLDLKFHDIPNTVAKAVYEAGSLGVWMLNVHASGGNRMLQEAKNSLMKLRKSPLLVAVTVLTSLSEEDSFKVGIKNIKDHSLSLAKLAKESGLDGVVCSSYELRDIKEVLGKDFLCVTPGIRLNQENEDQKRVSTPKKALEEGSDFLVIGREVTQHNNPPSALDEIISSIN